MNSIIKQISTLYPSTEGFKIFFSPGRINLIGEHTDYSGGMVFPCAISYGTFLLARPRTDQVISLYSHSYSDSSPEQFPISSLPERTDSWHDYPLSIFKTLLSNGIEIPYGFDLYFFGTLPTGSGLSSSASIETVTRYMLDTFLLLNTPRLIQAKECQFSENNFIGVNCGIMDQFAVMLGRKNSALLLNTNTLDYEIANWSISDYTFLIANTNKPRSLKNSEYNSRRDNLSIAYEILKVPLKLSCLGDIDITMLSEIKHLLEPSIFKRVYHVVTENDRTKKAYTAFLKNDISAFGQLMNFSHISLQKEYEVSCYELDVLQELSLSVKGVLGSRMTGAGFGGCTITLLKKDILEEFKTIITKKYFQLTNLIPTFYEAILSDGTRELTTEQFAVLFNESFHSSL